MGHSSLYLDFQVQVSFSILSRSWWTRTSNKLQLQVYSAFTFFLFYDLKRIKNTEPFQLSKLFSIVIPCLQCHTETHTHTHKKHENWVLFVGIFLFGTMINTLFTCLFSQYRKKNDLAFKAKCKVSELEELQGLIGTWSNSSTREKWRSVLSRTHFDEGAKDFRGIG